MRVGTSMRAASRLGQAGFALVSLVPASGAPTPEKLAVSTHHIQQLDLRPRWISPRAPANSRFCSVSPADIGAAFRAGKWKAWNGMTYLLGYEASAQVKWVGISRVILGQLAGP